jgi:hypothetical protein
LEIKQFDESIRQFDAEMARLKKKDAQEYAMEIKRLELQKQQVEQAKIEAQRDYELKQKQLQMQQTQFDKEHSLKQAQFRESQRQYNNTAQVLKEQNGENSVPSFKTYEEASAYMKKNGLATGDGGLMTKNEWTRRKGSGGKSAELAYSSYSEYLTAFVEWRAENPQK